MSSHVNTRGMPHMVDVGDKPPTRRRAVARGLVRVPAPPTAGPSGVGGASVGVGEPAADRREWYAPKGPVFQTAIIAGIQGAKETSRLIPLCHPLPLTHCDIAIARRATDGAPANESAEATTLEVVCTVETTAVTGVEMEALTGASVACLTIYDMLKSLTHGIEIQEIRLLEKRGGKSDWSAPQ